MFKGRSDHIVLASRNIQLTREFYEQIIGLAPGTVQANYVTYDFGGFLLCFKERSDLSDLGEAVVHLGVDFPKKEDVDSYFGKFKGMNVKTISTCTIGGAGQGPYRFYIKDPDGYTLEFESWEGCSD